MSLIRLEFLYNIIEWDEAFTSSRTLHTMAMGITMSMIRL